MIPMSLDRQCAAAGFPVPVPEYQFAKHLGTAELRMINQVKPRKWAVDFAWPDERIAVEVDGGLFNQGRHSRGAGMLGDMEKLNALACLGYRIIRVTPEHVRNGMALTWIQLALAKGAR
jgi:very-short-patch-repair endonuclease